MEMLFYENSIFNIVIDPCSSQPCLNEATCSSSSNGFACQCAGNWTGSTCSISNKRFVGPISR